MRHSLYKIIVIIVSCLTFNLAKAYAGYKENQIVAPHQWFADIAIGKSYDYGGNNVIGSSGNMLVQTDKATPPFFSAAIGHLWALPTNYFPFISMNLQYRYTSPTIMSGFLYDITANIINLDHSYFARYQIKQQSCSIVTKMDLYRWQNFMPYFSLGLGASWNKINQFSTTAFDLDPDPESMTPMEFFATKNTSSDFTYNLGIGIDYIVNPDLWLSLGYSYDGFGKNEIGQLLIYTGAADPLEPSNVFVKNASLHAHNIILSARYLFA